VTLIHHDNSAIQAPERPPDDVPGGGGRLPIFSYTVEPLAPLYRAVLRLFLDAKGRYRIQFRPEEHFTPADIGAPGATWKEGSVPDPALRGAAVLWLWRAVPGFVRALPAPRLLLAMRLIDGALFAVAVGIFFAIVAASTRTRFPELFAIPLFLVATLPFFAMTVSNYGLLIAAYVLLTAGIALDYRDDRGAAWAGPLIGFGWMIAALTARSAVPLAPFLAAWLLGRLLVGRRDTGWRASLVYWLGVSAFLVAGVWLAHPGYVRTTVGLGEQKLPGIFVRTALIVLAHPWLLLIAGLAAAAIERATAQRRPTASPAVRAVLSRAAIAAPLLMIASLVLSLLVRYPKLAFVDPFKMPPPVLRKLHFIHLVVRDQKAYASPVRHKRRRP